MNAIEKSVRRHAAKLKIKKKPKQKLRQKSDPWGVGMGYLERHDFETEAEYQAYRKSLRDDDYTPNHDGKIWMLPG